MNSGSIWNQVPSQLQKAIKVVQKPYSQTNTGSGSIKDANDKLFILSHAEIGGSTVWSGWHSSAVPYIGNEGVQYAYYAPFNIVTTDNKTTQQVLMKGNQSSPSTYSGWWVRTMRPPYTEARYLHIQSDGVLVSSSPVVSPSGVCPAFCL